ncbi:hypothetical protein AAJP47_05915 [Psychrobacter sp. B38]|uniref:hypothetical protein n=1 Tax=Psychrobacter sp. B38 TaxID=3143538 RepID=UPI00320CC225
MSIIEQLEKTVTPAIVGDSDSQDSVAYVSLLEQFYALLAARLALPHVYSDLIRSDDVLTADSAVDRPLFEQLWQDQAMQQTIINELAATHHIDPLTTSQLLNNAAPLAYRELKILADGQFLPAFLQGQQAALRPYLPIWSAPIITAIAATQNPSLESDLTPHSNRPNSNYLNSNYPNPTIGRAAEGRAADGTTTPVDTSVANPSKPNLAKNKIVPPFVENPDIERTYIDSPATHLETNTDAIHVNPSAHHWAENSSMKHEKIRTRNQRNDLLIRVFLLIVALAALALAAWALLFRPNAVPPVEPVAAEPVVVTPAVEPPAQVTTPVELIVAVDNTGSLYNCSATIGDAALQSSLQQALNTSFGEQASICELTIREGVASSIAGMPTEILSNVFTSLRSVPFARLHLQNDRLTLEAPDSQLLQRLITDVRTLAPTMAIDTNAPLPLPNSGSGDAVNNVVGMNGDSSQFGGDRSNNQYNNDYNGGSAQYQAADDNTGDRVIPAPNLPAPNNGSFNNNGNNVPTNNSNNAANNIPNNSPNSNSSNNNLPNNNVPNNNRPINNAPTRPSGPISLSEVDDMANSVIVVEPAQVR